MNFDMLQQPKRDFEGKAEFEGKSMRRQQPPSKVIHVRALPPMVTEAELAALFSPFGSVVKILLLSTKQQAFIEMSSAEAAQNVLTHFSQGAQLRGKQVYVQYSSRQQVTLTPPNGASSGGGPTPMLSGNSHYSASGALTGSAYSAPEKANHILLVSILNPRVPVTLDNIHEVFKPYGEVKKIITFVKDGHKFEALVQMGTTEAAVAAKHNLEGKDMFQGCCTLRIVFSKLTELTVKDNAGPKSRDFTRPVPGGVGVAGLYNPYSQPAQPQYMMAQPPAAAHGMGGYMMDGVPQHMMMGGVNGVDYGVDGPSQPGSVLLVNNLPKGFTADNVFILFGVYGDVIRVKILYNKRDTALVQFSSPRQAQLARVHLNDIQFDGKELKINTSKHNEVSLPRGDGHSSDLTKDFAKSPIHRFKHRGSRNMKNIHPPSQVLHVSNLPDAATEEELRSLFAAESSGDVKVQFFKNDRKMAYVRMPTLQEACMALIRLHNHKLQNRYMRVSFSGKDPAHVDNSDRGQSPGTTLGQPTTPPDDEVSYLKPT